MTDEPIMTKPVKPEPARRNPTEFVVLEVTDTGTETTGELLKRIPGTFKARNDKAALKLAFADRVGDAPAGVAVPANKYAIRSPNVGVDYA